MNKDFPDPKKITAPSLSGDEEIVYIHGTDIVLPEGAGRTSKRKRCPKCSKDSHCYVELQDGAAEFIDTCSKGFDCRCFCRTHYDCAECGRLHPYTQKLCSNKEKPRVSDPESDKKSAKIMEDWRKKKSHSEKPMEIENDTS